MLMTLSGARCEPNFAQFATAAPDDPLYNPLYENALMSLESAWNISTGSEELVVVVIDSGVLYTHPDLAGNVWINRNEIAGNGIDDDGNSVIDDVYGVERSVQQGTHWMTTAMALTAPVSLELAVIMVRALQESTGALKSQQRNSSPAQEVAQRLMQ
jgi:subtilisin family serine protease